MGLCWTCGSVWTMPLLSGTDVNEGAAVAASCVCAFSTVIRGLDVINFAGASLALATAVSQITASGVAREDLLLFGSLVRGRDPFGEAVFTREEAMATGVMVVTVDMETGAGDVTKKRASVPDTCT